MAYWIQGIGGNGKSTSHRLFFCDSESDISDLPTLLKEGKKQKNSSIAHLPCAIGSKALVISTGDRYILKSTDKWKSLPTTSSGGGSDEPGGDNDYVDEDDIDNLFPDTPTNPDTDSSVNDETLILSDSNGTVDDETWVIG